MIDGLLEKRLVLVTGKGGVGRTTVAAGLAFLAQRMGKRVLVGEIAEDGGANSALAQMFGRARLPALPQTVAPGIDGGALLSRTGQELFLTSVIHVAPLARAAINSDALRRLMQAGPALRELGLLFHLLHHLQHKRANGEWNYQFIVLDMPATGHMLALTSLPRVVLDLAPRGPIANAVRECLSMLHDPTLTGVYPVTLPETLPVTETLELLEGLRASSMPAAGIILNRMPTHSFTPEERAVLEPLMKSRPMFGARSLQQEENARRAVERLRAATTLPLLSLPELVERDVPLLRAMADQLAARNGIGTEVRA